MERQSVVELLKLNVRHEFSLVLGWYLHEILASLEVASALLLDAEIRSLLLRHVMQAQSYYDSKTERSFLHLLETRPLATFIASFISHNLSSSSSSSSSPPSSPLTPLFSSSPSFQPATPISLSSLSSSTSSLTSSCGLSSSTSSIISSISTLAINSSLSSSSLSSMMMVLTRQQQGLFPFLLLHIDEIIVYNCFDSILRNCEKPVELHMIIGRAICTEFMFQSPKVINGNLIWKVEKLANLLSTFIETMGDNFTQLGSSVAAMVEPLSHFILKFTNASFCSELSFLRLSNLIITKFSSTPALRNLVPQMIQSVSFSFPSLTSSLKDDSIPSRSENSGERRRDKLNVVALFEGILKYTAEYPQVMENMVAHNVVEKVCKVAFSSTDCSSSFFHLSLSFLRSVLSSGFTYLITPSLIKDLTAAVNNSPKRHKHFTALSQELSKIPELAPLFSGENSTPEIPVKKRSPRQSLKLALTQSHAKEKMISKYLRQIFRSEEHPYGMVVSDFGRRLAKGFQLEDDKEKMLNDIKNTVDTFAKSVAETIRIEEGVINLPVFDLSSLCLEASFEVILSREPTVVLHFYRTKFIAKDRKLQSVIKAWGHKVTPSDLHVPDHFLTKEELNKETPPFGEAIDIFKRFMSKKSPLEKVRKLKSTVTSICGRTPSKNSSEHGTPISADDLMAIFTYVILKTEVKTLVSDSEFMGDFLGKHNLAGEPGYLITTLQCCCMFIASGEFMKMMKNVGQDKAELKNLDKPA